MSGEGAANRMFIVTTKLSGKKLLCGAAAVAAILLGVRVATQFAGDVSALGTAVGSAVAASSDGKGSTRASSNEERVEYLSACGWDVDPDSCVVQDVVIPSDFNEVYQNYAEMQTQQGFHLEKYRGKRVKLTTYTVKNAPEGMELEANLLIFRNKVIAGDITSLGDGGTAYGLVGSGIGQQEESADNSGGEGEN